MYVRVTVRVIWYKGNSDDKNSAFRLEGWIDGWTDGHRCLLYQIVVPELLKLVECVFSCREFNVALKGSDQGRR